jgi:hypothetical protein
MRAESLSMSCGIDGAVEGRMRDEKRKVREPEVDLRFGLQSSLVTLRDCPLVARIEHTR